MGQARHNTASTTLTSARHGSKQGTYLYAIRYARRLLLLLCCLGFAVQNGNACRLGCAPCYHLTYLLCVLPLQQPGPRTISQATRPPSTRPSSPPDSSERARLQYISPSKRKHGSLSRQQAGWHSRGALFDARVSERLSGCFCGVLSLWYQMRGGSMILNGLVVEKDVLMNSIHHCCCTAAR